LILFPELHPPLGKGSLYAGSDPPEGKCERIVKDIETETQGVD